MDNSQTQTTFDRLINSDPELKKEFENEYNTLLLSEFFREIMTTYNLSSKELSKKLHFSKKNVERILKGKKVKFNFLMVVIIALVCIPEIEIQKNEMQLNVYYKPKKIDENKISMSIPLNNWKAIPSFVH